MTTVLYFDTETTGKWVYGATDMAANQPNLVQLACILENFETSEIHNKLDLIVHPNGWKIAEEAANIHGIPQELAEKYGITLLSACKIFYDLYHKADYVVAHNIAFDSKIILRAILQTRGILDWRKEKERCTMKASTYIVKAAPKTGKKEYKWPSLQETHTFFFGANFENAHDAMADCEASRKVYHELVRRGAFTHER